MTLRVMVMCAVLATVMIAGRSPILFAADVPAPTPAGHAASGVQAGTHADWCAEHAVPESLCTRCNPALVPAFKATNDWCAEHGLPESQCLVCNPDLKIERPPKAGAQ